MEMGVCIFEIEIHLVFHSLNKYLLSFLCTETMYVETPYHDSDKTNKTLTSCGVKQ